MFLDGRESAVGSLERPYKVRRRFRGQGPGCEGMRDYLRWTFKDRAKSGQLSSAHDGMVY